MTNEKAAQVVEVGDVVDIFENRAEVVEVYTSDAGTPFILAEDIDGNFYRFPVRLVDVVWCKLDGELVAAEDVEVEPVAGLWYDGETETAPEAAPKNLWADVAQEVA